MKKNKEVIHYKKNIAGPFVKWAGGKNQLIEQLSKFFPKKDDYKKYIEPFVGGGAIFFHLQPKKAILSDLNDDLINCYKIIRDDIDTLITILEKYKKKHSKNFYYELRNLYNSNKLDRGKRAAAFLYLNKTSYNGIHRVNSKGHFNVPYGKHVNASIYNTEKIIAASDMLKDVDLQTMSYEKVVKYAKKGDFVYLDPPYYPLNKTSNFTNYTKYLFLDAEHEKLLNIFKILDKRGCKVMLSNSNTKFIRSLYKKYYIHEVKAKRFINCMGEKRGNVIELVIVNYNITKK